MTRFAVIGLVGLASLISFAAGAGLTTLYLSRRFDDQIRSDNAYWTSTLGREVSVGESKADARAWVERHVPGGEDNFDPAERKISGVVEKVYDPIGYPCASLSLTVEITIGVDDRVASREMTTSGLCI